MLAASAGPLALAASPGVASARVLTLFWTGVLFGMAALQVASVHAGEWAWLFRWVLPLVVLVAAVKGSHAYRRWVRRDQPPPPEGAA